MKPYFDEPKLVRGVVVVGSRYGSIVRKENDDCAVARTLWYRHDDDLDELEETINALARVLMKTNKCSVATLGYEYKDYRK